MHLPVPAAILYPGFIETPIKGGSRSELEARELPGTRRVVSNPTLTDIQIKETESSNSSLTRLPVLAGILDPDLAKTQ